MHRASNFTNIGQAAITIIVTNRGGRSNRKKGHSRLLNLIRISLVPTNQPPIYQCYHILTKIHSSTPLSCLVPFKGTPATPISSFLVVSFCFKSFLVISGQKRHEQFLLGTTPVYTSASQAIYTQSCWVHGDTPTHETVIINHKNEHHYGTFFEA